MHTCMYLCVCKYNIYMHHSYAKVELSTDDIRIIHARLSCSETAKANQADKQLVPPPSLTLDKLS